MMEERGKTFVRFHGQDCAGKSWRNVSEKLLKQVFRNSLRGHSFDV